MAPTPIPAATLIARDYITRRAGRSGKRSKLGVGLVVGLICLALLIIVFLFFAGGKGWLGKSKTTPEQEERQAKVERRFWRGTKKEEQEEQGTVIR